MGFEIDFVAYRGFFSENVDGFVNGLLEFLGRSVKPELVL